MMLVDTTLSASHFAERYQPTGAVLISEEAFPDVGRSLWTFTANIPQFSLLRASFIGARDASVLATSSRADDETMIAYSTNLWNLDRIDQLTDNYNFQYNPGPYTGADTHLYVMDTGVVPNSPEFGGRVSLDYTAVGSQFADDNNHGSHVSGIAASSTYGVAKQANIHSYKILSSTGSGTLSWLAQGLVHLRGNLQSPAVINLSLTYAGYDAVIDALLTELIALGVHVVAAGGNSGVDACSTYPCITSGVVCVGSTTKVDQRSSFSNYGTCIDIFAPGSLIISIDKNGNALTLSGTSMAAPHVAAAILLYLQANPYATPAQVVSALLSIASQNQLLVTTLGARSPNKMLYVVWGSVPATSTLGGPTIITVSTTGGGGTITVTSGSTGTTSTASIAASTSLASTSARVTATQSATTTNAKATTTLAASTSVARTTSSASMLSATSNAKSTSTAVVSTSKAATSTLSTSTKSTSTAVTSTRSASTRAVTSTRGISTSLSRTTSVALTTTGRASTSAHSTSVRTTTTAASSKTTRSVPSSAESGTVILPIAHALLWVIFSVWILAFIDLPERV